MSGLEKPGGSSQSEAAKPVTTVVLPERKPFRCEQGHVQVNKCKFGHPVYAHDTENGWCCACDADIAFAEAWLRRTKPEIFKEAV